jgi:hypothetical protein
VQHFDGHAGRAHFATKRHHDIVEVTPARRSKASSSSARTRFYRPDQRSSHWRKLKHRRRETWPSRPGRRATQVRHDHVGGSTPAALPCLRAACSSDHDRREILRALLVERETPRTSRRRVRHVTPGGAARQRRARPDAGVLRDTVIRDVNVDA